MLVLLFTSERYLATSLWIVESYKFKFSAGKGKEREGYEEQLVPTTTAILKNNGSLLHK